MNNPRSEGVFSASYIVLLIPARFNCKANAGPAIPHPIIIAFLFFISNLLNDGKKEGYTIW